jgi:hypothetical protein
MVIGLQIHNTTFQEKQQFLAIQFGEKTHLLLSKSKSTTEAQSAAEPKRPSACIASDICLAGSLDMMRAARRVSVRPATAASERLKDNILCVLRGACSRRVVLV